MTSRKMVAEIVTLREECKEGRMLSSNLTMRSSKINSSLPQQAIHHKLKRMDLKPNDLTIRRHYQELIKEHFKRKGNNDCEIINIRLLNFIQ
jgi:hypothetical protein